MDYLEGLNVSQREAVEATEGPVMVIAGAGSGKTRVLTYRIAHIINKGVSPFNILSLTFTNKAAGEMKERIAKIVGQGTARSIWMGTFHSVFAKILRSEAERIGFPSNFTIYDTQDAKNLLKTIIKEQGLDDKVYKPGLVLNRISAAKNNLISAAGYLKNTTIQSEDTQSAKPKLGLIYEIYEKRCFKAGAMDFDDLLFKTNVLLRDFPEVLHQYQHRFKYILVDEYQDTNFSQYLIVKKLAAAFENVCVVGDDAQSIYAFRGANIQNILNFKSDYPDVRTFKLEQNYRSTKHIVQAANSVITYNKDQIKKDVWTSNDDGQKIKVYKSASDNEEGMLIASQVFDIQYRKQKKFSDFAILYRTNSQSRALEEALRKKNIPYKIYGGQSFYQRKEIKDLISYFRLIVNPKDEEALKRVINYPARGIGKTTMDKLTIHANNSGNSLWDVVNQLGTNNLGLNAGTQKKIYGFVTMMQSFASAIHNKDAYTLAHEVAATSGLLKELHSDKTPEGISRYENIQELLNGIKEFAGEEDEVEQKTLAEFLQDVALLTDADNEKEEDLNKVTLMTIHASKGLEFPYVFIVGLEENLFPSQMSIMSRADLEEERRLFYVALTRAEKEVALSFATSRYKWGNLIFCEPSRFLEEVDADHKEIMYAERERTVRSETKVRSTVSTTNKPIRMSDNRNNNAPKKNLKKLSEANGEVKMDGSAPTIEVGMIVLHEKFGKGEVLTVEGNIGNQKAEINFEKAGKKQLLLKFAKLRVLGRK